MSTKTYSYKDFDDEDGYSNKRRKHSKHAHNIRGEGMRTLNSYVEEDDEDFYDDFDDTIHENT